MGLFSRFVASKTGTIVGAVISVGAAIPATLAVHDATTGKTFQQATFVDESSNNAPGNLAKYDAAGHATIAPKASEGTGYAFSGYGAIADQAHALGETVWPYDFVRPDYADATAECHAFLAAVRGHWRAGDRAVEDLETAGSRTDAQLAAWSNTWRSCVAQTVGAAAIVVYTGPWFINPRPVLYRSLYGVDIWIAAYQNTEPNLPGLRVIAWQFTDHGQVAGFPDPLDVSVDLTYAVTAPDVGQPSQQPAKGGHISSTSCPTGLVFWAAHGCYRLVRIPAGATGVRGFAYWNGHGWTNTHKLPARARGVRHYRHTSKGWVAA